MRRASLVVGILLACNTGTPAVPAPEPTKPTASASPTTPVAPAPAGCEATVLELVVEAPADRALLVDSPTLPLARREVAAGAALRERFDPARPGVHLIQLRDAGQPDVVDHRPLVVLEGEHHHWTGGNTPRHRIERCAQGVLAPLHDSDSAPATGWDSLLVSADGATFARLSPYTRRDAAGIELALIHPTQGARRMPLVDARAPDVDPALLTAASEVLVRDGFKRVDPRQLRPVRDVALREQAIHARWRDRIGTIPLPAPPDPALPSSCCAWTSPHALALPDAQAVLVDLRFTCDAGSPGCDPRVVDPAWIVVPLTADAPAQARYRAIPESAAQALADALGPAHGLGYPPQVGPFGPAPDGLLVLSKDDAGRLGGYVETEFEGAVTRLPLPDLPWAMSEVHEILFEDADGDGRDDAIILVNAMTGVGPTGAEEFFGAHVLGWNGSEFVHLTEVERKLDRAKSVAAVRKLLRPPPPKPR